MAVELCDQIKSAVDRVVSTTEQSGNTTKVHKQIFFVIVCTIQKLFVKLRDSRDSKTTEIGKLEMQVIKMKAELEECSDKNFKVYGTPSLIP